MSKKRKRKKVSKSKRQTIHERDQYLCYICGCQLNALTATVDHVKPRSKGGTNDPSNLRTCCKPCNSTKGSKLLKNTRQQANKMTQYRIRCFVSLYYLEFLDNRKNWRCFPDFEIRTKYIKESDCLIFDNFAVASDSWFLQAKKCFNAHTDCYVKRVVQQYPDISVFFAENRKLRAEQLKIFETQSIFEYLPLSYEKQNESTE